LSTVVAARAARSAGTQAPRAGAAGETPAARGLGEEEERLLAALGDEEQAIDEVVRLSGLDAGRANGLLVGLQIKRRVRLLPGGRVRKC